MPKKKGFTDVSFMLTFIVFFTTLVFITSQLAPYGVPALSGIDVGILGGSVIGVGVACTIITGFGCAIAAIVSSVISIFAIPPIYQIIFIPLLFVYAFIMAKLARGTG